MATGSARIVYGHGTGGIDHRPHTSHKGDIGGCEVYDCANYELAGAGAVAAAGVIHNLAD